MSIIINTQDPQGLFKSIKDNIDDKRIVTWSYDADNDFTHTPDQWDRKAWLRPHILVMQKQLIFGIVYPVTAKIADPVTYGIYHGRFIEMLLTHFDEKFSTANATAGLTNYDVHPRSAQA